MAASFWPAGRRAALSLTLDDARVTQVDRGLALLARHGVKATFYVSPPALVERLEGWREAVRAGHEIGNHTLTHPCSANFAFARDNSLEEASLESMAHELDEASRRVEELLAVRPVTFAYPCGNTFVGRGRTTRSYVPLVAERFLAGRGYLNGETNDPERCDLSQLVSVGLDRAPLAHVTDLIDGALSDGSWLILTGHDMGGGDDEPLSVDFGALESVLRFAEERELWMATVAEIAGHLAKRGQAPARPGA